VVVGVDVVVVVVVLRPLDAVGGAVVVAGEVVVAWFAAWVDELLEVCDELPQAAGTRAHAIRIAARSLIPDMFGRRTDRSFRGRGRCTCHYPVRR
jgi:hypothetical protein